jgi:DNA-binding NarL/FixJ family response regulator
MRCLFHGTIEGVGPEIPRRRIFLVDDHPLVRDGLTKLIDQQADLCVCGEADQAGQAFDEIQRTQPDAVVVDLTLRGESGFELIKRLKSLPHPPAILVLSMHDEVYYAERAIRAGALGYVMKRETSSSIISALHDVLLGRLHLSDAITQQISGQLLRLKPVFAESPVVGLSAREFEVFHRIGIGRENRQIAEELHISLKTVQTHCGHIKRKLRLETGTILVREAVRWVEKHEGRLNQP